MNLLGRVGNVVAGAVQQELDNGWTMVGPELVELKGTAHRSLYPTRYSSPAMVSLVAVPYAQSAVTVGNSSITVTSTGNSSVSNSNSDSNSDKCQDPLAPYYVYHLLINGKIKIFITASHELEPKQFAVVNNSIEQNVLLLVAGKARGKETLFIRFPDQESFLRWQDSLSYALAETLCIESFRRLPSGRLSSVRIAKSISICNLIVSAEKSVMVRARTLCAARQKLSEVIRAIRSDPNLISRTDIDAILAIAQHDILLREDPDVQLLQRLGTVKDRQQLEDFCKQITYDELEEIAANNWSWGEEYDPGNYDTVACRKAIDHASSSSNSPAITPTRQHGSRTEVTGCVVVSVPSFPDQPGEVGTMATSRPLNQSFSVEAHYYHDGDSVSMSSRNVSPGSGVTSASSTDSHVNSTTYPNSEYTQQPLRTNRSVILGGDHLLHSPNSKQAMVSDANTFRSTTGQSLASLKDESGVVNHFSYSTQRENVDPLLNIVVGTSRDSSRPSSFNLKLDGRKESSDSLFRKNGDVLSRTSSGSASSTYWGEEVSPSWDSISPVKMTGQTSAFFPELPSKNRFSDRLDCLSPVQEDCVDLTLGGKSDSASNRTDKKLSGDEVESHVLEWDEDQCDLTICEVADGNRGHQYKIQSIEVQNNGGTFYSEEVIYEPSNLALQSCINTDGVNGCSDTINCAFSEDAVVDKQEHVSSTLTKVDNRKVSATNQNKACINRISPFLVVVMCLLVSAAVLSRFSVQHNSVAPDDSQKFSPKLSKGMQKFSAYDRLVQSNSGAESIVNQLEDGQFRDACIREAVVASPKQEARVPAAAAVEEYSSKDVVVPTSKSISYKAESKELEGATDKAFQKSVKNFVSTSANDDKMEVTIFTRHGEQEFQRQAFDESNSQIQKFFQSISRSINRIVESVRSLLRAIFPFIR